MHDWPGNRNPFTLPMCAWSAEKADAGKIVWTKPYDSKLSGGWVVACLAPVRYGERLAAVAGCEIPVSRLAAELPQVKPEHGGVCWLERGDGIVLAASASGQPTLGVVPIAEAQPPDPKAPLNALFKAATITEAGKPKLKEAWAGLAGKQDSAAVGAEDGGVITISAPLPTVKWVLGQQLELLALRDAATGAARAWHVARMLFASLAAVLLASIALGVFYGWFESRPVSRSVSILTSQVNQAVKAQTPTAVATAHEDELGALSQAVQGLIDLAFTPQQRKETPAEPAPPEPPPGSAE
jgi:hypothetical protein